MTTKGDIRAISRRLQIVVSASGLSLLLISGAAAAQKAAPRPEACTAARQEERAKVAEAERAVEYYRELIEKTQRDLIICTGRPAPPDDTTGTNNRPVAPPPDKPAEGQPAPNGSPDAARIAELARENERLRAALASGGGEPTRRLIAIRRQFEPDVANVAERVRAELPCSDIQIGLTDDVTGFIRGAVRSKADIDKATQAVRESPIGRFFPKHDLAVGEGLDRCAAAISQQWALRRTQNGQIAVLQDNEIDPGDRERLPEVQSCRDVGAILEASEVFRAWDRDQNHKADALVWARSDKALRQCWRKDGRWQSSATDTGGWSGLVLLPIR